MLIQDMFTCTYIRACMNITQKIIILSEENQFTGNFKFAIWS